MKKLLILSILSILILSGCAAANTQNTDLPVIDTGVDPNAWALIPAGEFLKGQNEYETLLDYDYEIMITDVTNAQYAEYLNLALEAGWITLEEGLITGYYPGDEFDAHEHEEEITAGDWLHLDLSESALRIMQQDGQFLAKPGYENHPAIMVTWFGAKSYCEFYDGRLPLENEWEKAARGTDNRPYPWGSGLEANQANYYSSSDLFEKISGKMGDTTPVGFYNGQSHEGYQTIEALSPYGLYDMAGNVWQWAGDVYPYQHYRYLRGGSKAEYGYNLRVWTRNSAGPDFAGINIGFRCARDPLEN